MKPRDLADLRRDAARLVRGTDATYVLFSRLGFDPALRAETAVRLVTPADLFRPALDFGR